MSPEPSRTWLVPAAAAAIVVVLGAILVAFSLRRPDVPMYAPTPPAPKNAGPVRVGPILYTVDATSPDTWRYFSFRLGSVVDDPGPRAWDLAFRRFQIIANSGPGFSGQAGLLDLGAVAFETVVSAPTSGYRANEGRQDPTNPAIARWYSYGFFSHVLKPLPHVWAVRTADGRYAKIAIVSYYGPGARPGCLTFRYVYQGDGSTALEATR